MLCDSLNGKGIWERMDKYIRIAKSFLCSPESVTTLLISYIPIQNKFFKKMICLSFIENSGRHHNKFFTYIMLILTTVLKQF